jgi:hypothetical protein
MRAKGHLNSVDQGRIVCGPRSSETRSERGHWGLERSPAAVGGGTRQRDKISENTGECWPCRVARGRGERGLNSRAKRRGRRDARSGWPGGVKPHGAVHRQTLLPNKDC